MGDVLTTLGPLAETGAQLAAVIATVVVCWRLINSTWTTAAATLRESANYAREEADQLRERLDQLEQRSREQAAIIAAFEGERARWMIERSQLEHTIRGLEDKVTELTTHLDQLDDQVNGNGH